MDSRDVANRSSAAAQDQDRRSLDELVLEARPKLSRSEATEIVGGLSRTSKMPCHSWGIPATSCKTGSRLERIPGTVCHDCYAMKGAYRWPTVNRAYERRLARADHPDWNTAMAELVGWQAEKNRQPYFRWFDSGDLQSISMLERIAAVARMTPDVQHWLPTREYAFVKGFRDQHEKPDNLTIRVSSTHVDSPAHEIDGLPTSTVHRLHQPLGYECPAYATSPASCGDCRACWSPSTQNVSYKHH